MQNDHDPVEDHMNGVCWHDRVIAALVVGSTAVFMLWFAGFFPQWAYADVCYISTTGSFATSSSFGYGPPYNSAAGIKFSTASDCSMTGIGSWLALSGTVTQNANYSLYDDSAGAPGSLIVTGTSVAHGSLSSSVFNHATSTFATTTLTAGTTYWLVLEGSAQSTSGYFIFGGAGSVAPHNFEGRNSGVWGALTTTDTAWIEVDGTVAAPPAAASTSTLAYGLGALFLVSFGWFLILFVEACLLFIPIYWFAVMFRGFTGL